VGAVSLISRPFEIDSAADLTRTFHYDDETDEITIETLQDVEALIEQNKYASNDDSGSWKGEWHMVAQVPMNLYSELVSKGITRDKKKFKEWINGRDQRFFRVKPGRV
jgi:hypothetical protein